MKTQRPKWRFNLSVSSARPGNYLRQGQRLNELGPLLRTFWTFVDTG